MSEALRAIIDYGFAHVGLHSIEAQIHPGNTASRRVLERLGFVQEGYFRENFYDPIERGFTDTAVFSLVKHMETLPIITDAPLQAPLPAWVYPILNPTLKFLLRTPFHTGASSIMMILIFEGRKTGKRYEVVVTYHEEGGKLYTFSNTKWSKNFIGGAPVALRLRGKLVRATATVVDDMALIGRVIQRMATDHGEQLVIGMNLMGSDSNGTHRLQMPKDSRLVEFTLH